MNHLLQLKGNFNKRKNRSKFGAVKLRKDESVNVEHLHKLKESLISVYKFWEKDTILKNPLVSVHYTRVMPKSNRLQILLSKGSKKPNSFIVGAKFSNDSTRKHIITYCITKEIIKNTIDLIEKAIIVVNSEFGGIITANDFDNKKIDVDKNILSSSKFAQIIVDAYHIEKFNVEVDSPEIKENAIITIYETGMQSEELMDKLNINFLFLRKIDNTTMLLTPEEYNILREKAPYLIAMAVRDLSKLEMDSIIQVPLSKISIPEPNNEPIIGVIDTLFDESVYFSKWVEYTNMIDKNIPINSNDYKHGTAVSSIIVDGPSFNPDLDDGCGRFRVRHFGVAVSGQFSSFTILKNIREIISKNRDIKVWNLSLGSMKEINQNFISPEAAELDKIQFEYDVIFVIAGTNRSLFEDERNDVVRIGAPADSINALVVNAVKNDNTSASYTRVGPVLSFFNKPDISYYGGDLDEEIFAYDSLGKIKVIGTSFAAPWIARKLAYLIHILGLSREVAKALIIDSATGWNSNEEASIRIGYGVVPKKIEDVVNSKDDEIKFILTSEATMYETYNLNIPVPKYKEEQPFISKATLCYFPKCSKNQGVDYTNTELSIQFGKFNKKGTIKTINNDVQDAGCYIYEKTARENFRKWDNVKHICEFFKSRKRPKKLADTNGLWGISIKRKERLDANDGTDLKFAVIITLKEINGVNRIEDFIYQCQLRGWLVNEIDIHNQVEVYNQAETNIIFE